MNKYLIKLILIIYILCTSIFLGSINVLLFFIYFYLLFLILSYIFCSKEAFSLLKFTNYYIIASTIATTYILIQSNVYPETYGTTSRFGSWTDDSYFFTLIANKIPSNFFIERDQYFYYNSGFAEILKTISPLKIYYPIDVIFFQTGIMSLLALSIYDSNLLFNNLKSTIPSNLIIYSPFLYMNGGAILVRDVFVSTLFIIGLNCLYKKNYLLSFIVILLEIYIRPGTAIIIIILLIIYFTPTIISKIKINFTLMASGFIAILLILLNFPLGSIEEILVEEGVSVFGREVFYSLESTSGQNTIYLQILNQPLVVKLFLTGVYFYLYPWISFSLIKNDFGYDLRTILINIVYPIINISYNYFFINALLNKKTNEQKRLIYIYLIGLALLGTYSLETRHKTVLIPLFYLIIAPAINSKKNIKIVPLTISIMIFLGTIIINIFK